MSPSPCSFMTALYESFALTVSLPVISCSTSTSLLFSRVGNPFLTVEGNGVSLVTGKIHPVYHMLVRYLIYGCHRFRKCGLQSQIRCSVASGHGACWAIQ